MEEGETMSETIRGETIAGTVHYVDGRREAYLREEPGQMTLLAFDESPELFDRSRDVLYAYGVLHDTRQKGEGAHVVLIDARRATYGEPPRPFVLFRDAR
jgi:hypothetical protein